MRCSSPESGPSLSDLFYDDDFTPSRGTTREAGRWRGEGGVGPDMLNLPFVARSAEGGRVRTSAHPFKL